MQHHKLNFLICQDSWLVPFIIQSYPSERQECFLHGCVREGNLFPWSCSTRGGTGGSGQGVPALGALQKDASLAKSLRQDTRVAALCFAPRTPTAAGGRAAGEVLLFGSLWCRPEPSVALALLVSRAALRSHQLCSCQVLREVLTNRSMMLTLVLLFQLSRLAATSNILLCRKGKWPYEVGCFWPPSSRPSRPFGLKAQSCLTHERGNQRKGSFCKCISLMEAGFGDCCLLKII